jgi:FixJ family two-component response regulator
MELNKIVAVVEPNAAMAAALQRFLHTHGYVAEIFSSAENFLTRLPRMRIDCLILSMDLGGITGMALHRQLVEERKLKLPVIFVTGDPVKSVDTASLAEGWIACLRMPLELRALRHALGTAMEVSVTQGPMPQPPAPPRISYMTNWRAGTYADNMALKSRGIYGRITGGKRGNSGNGRAA